MASGKKWKAIGSNAADRAKTRAEKRLEVIQGPGNETKSTQSGAQISPNYATLFQSAI